MLSPIRSLSAVIGLALVIGAVLANVAQAEPKLKAASYPVTYEGSGGASKVTAGGHEISCTGNTTSGEISAPEGGEQRGKSTTKFTGCAVEGAKCKTEGGKTGEILVNGPVNHYVLVGPAEEDQSLYGLVELEVSASVACGLIHVSVKGTLVVILLVKEGKPTKSFEAEAKGSGEGQEFTKCEEPKALCEGGTFSLTSEFVEGKPEAAVLTVRDKVTTSAEVTPEG